MENETRPIETPQATTVTPVESSTSIEAVPTTPTAERVASAKKHSPLHHLFPLKRDYTIALVVLLVLLAIAGLNYFKGMFIAATVNGDTITRLEVIRDLEARSGREALDSLVTTKVIHDAAVAQNIVVSQDTLNQEIEKIRVRIEKQGSKLEEILASQGLSMEALLEQLTSQKELEGLLAEKINVTSDEVTQYITDNKIPTPKDMSKEEFEAAIQDQLKSQKLNQEASTWIESAKKAASIQYFAPYALPLGTEPTATPSQEAN